MRSGAQVVIGAIARLYTPIIALFALALLADRTAGGGVGFIAGMGFGLVIVLHALVFGAAAAGSAFPPALARLLLALGVFGVGAGAGLPGFEYATQAIEAGLFVATVSTLALIVQVMFGRVPTLRDAEL
jgi:hypothetical protein